MRFVLKDCLVIAVMLCCLEQIPMPKTADGERPILKAIATADYELKLKGLDVTTLELVSAKRFQTESNDLVQSTAQDPYSKNLLSRLRGKTYWLIYYVPKKDQLGGDIGVFIDAETWNVIDLYRGR